MPIFFTEMTLIGVCLQKKKNNYPQSTYFYVNLTIDISIET